MAKAKILDPAYSRIIENPIEDYDGRQQIVVPIQVVPVQKERVDISHDLIRCVLRDVIHNQPIHESNVRDRCRRYTRCYRCEYRSHYANECFADYDKYGNIIQGRKPIPVPSTGRRRGPM